MVQIGMRLKDAKALFFDRPAVIAMLNRRERSMLSRFGAFVRRRAKSSIKFSSKNETSQPGRAPKGHTHKLRDKIYFAADPRRRSVVTGPVTFGGRTGEELQALEEGGFVNLKESIKGEAVRRRRVFIRARPFMLPAFKAELPKATSLMAQVS